MKNFIVYAVYINIGASWERTGETCLLTIFATRELAEKYIDERRIRYPNQYDYEIQEFEVIV